MSAKCPQCQSEEGLEGSVYNLIDYINPPAYFRPRAAFYAIFKNNVKFQNTFYACPSCGLVWTRVDSEKLKSIIFSKKQDSIAEIR